MRVAKFILNKKNSSASMRIAYLCSVNTISEAGPCRKVREQCQTWSEMGHDVRLIATHRGRVGFPRKTTDRFEICEIQTKNILSKFLSTKQIARTVNEFSPDIIYLRYQSVSPLVVSCAKIAPLVVELNGVARRNSFKQKLIYKLSRRWYSKHASGFVVVSNEMIELCADIISNKPSTVVRNGMSLRSGGTCQTTKPQKAAIFIGNGTPWHGLDRLHTIASHLPDWHFHVVCPNPQSWNLPNVTEHGYLPISKYHELLEKSTIGIGPLALERAGLKEASALKIGEYLLGGLPFIINYQETNMPEDSDFIFKINDNQLGESELNSIRQFMDGWASRTFDPKPYYPLIDLGVLEKKRLAFFRKLIG